MQRRTGRRQWLAAATAAVASASGLLRAQEVGERPQQDDTVTILNPCDRVPVGLIIDDSTCLVNLNRFAVPQFAEALGPNSPHASLPWREWPQEIPDSFVRKFGEWCAEEGVKGKYSIVPYPACVGRIDRILPGWTRKELEQSIDLVRNLMLPNWDIHPEMVTHTRVIDLSTGHPYQDASLKFMENWDWATGRSTDELASYMAYALSILKNVGLPCEGVTTPGGFASKARPQLAEGTFQSVRDVFQAEIPHYFRDLSSEGTASVAPLVQNVRGLKTNDPQCVVHVRGCTGDWTGGWDNQTPEGADRFITADLSSGRMVDVIRRGEPALMVCHWTGIHFNGRELGFDVFREVVRRLKAAFENLIWMKLSEVSRYWAAKELTETRIDGRTLKFTAPYRCSNFTVQFKPGSADKIVYQTDSGEQSLEKVSHRRNLRSGSWHLDGSTAVACVELPKGNSQLKF
ncbi:MAG: hypothetical protein JNM43_29640 [Planctomycetaceae bacterium]|nr:hypothetical protein [Planctomycetaceae bacterium]